MDVVRAGVLADARVPAHAETALGENLMDTGIQLGRRFRSLKLWMILRSFGARAIREHLARHIALAQQFAAWVDAHPDFERLAPVPFSVVCFRWNPEGRRMQRCRARRRERAAAGHRQSERRGVSLAHAHPGTACAAPGGGPPAND